MIIDNTIFNRLDKRTIKLFYDSEWTTFAYNWMDETNREYVAMFHVLGNAYTFYSTIIRLADQAFISFKNSLIENNIDTFTKSNKPLPEDFSNIVNTIELQATEYAQNEIIKYINEQVNH